MTDIINNEPLRLAKLIAQSGLCSRKEASRLISKGQVRVNGEMARHLHAITDTDHRRSGCYLSSAGTFAVLALS
ncbi:S4 domain-containing protein [Alishewanella longhuensis]